MIVFSPGPSSSGSSSITGESTPPPNNSPNPQVATPPSMPADTGNDVFRPQLLKQCLQDLCTDCENARFMCVCKLDSCSTLHSSFTCCAQLKPLHNHQDRPGHQGSGTCWVMVSLSSKDCSIPPPITSLLLQRNQRPHNLPHILNTQHKNTQVWHRMGNDLV